MRRALYYPHTELRETTPEGESLLKRALLLWDKLEYIAPFDNYQPQYSDWRFSEAMEIIGHKHVPTDDEKGLVHTQIEEFVTRPRVPEVFYYHGQSEPYEIYPQKFSEGTWELLRDSKLAGEIVPWSGDYPLTDQAGLVMMALLADTCAGNLCSRITDRPQSYASLTGLLLDNPQFDTEPAATCERLITANLELLDLRTVSIDELIKFRKREEKEAGLTKLRHNYLERLEAHLGEIRVCDNESDKKRLEEAFHADLKRDATELLSELQTEFKEALLSKEILVCLVAGAATAATTWLGAPPLLSGVMTAASVPASIAGVLSTRNRYYKNRAKIMKEHPMAYLYQFKSGLTL